MMTKKHIPFGETDASKASEVFFNRTGGVSPIDFETNLTDSTPDTSARIIIGKKGAGKTFYIKSMIGLLSTEPINSSVYLTDYDCQVPTTASVHKAHHWMTRSSSMVVPTEVWKDLWRTSIVLSALSHIAFHKQLSSYRIEDDKKSIVKVFRKFKLDINSYFSILQMMGNILDVSNSWRDLHDITLRSVNVEAENILRELIRQCPPFYYFLDQLDEQFVSAPIAWTACQVGLFNAIFELIRKTSFGGRLHVIACLREVVYTYVLSLEHGTKFVSESRIIVLSWKYKSIYNFFLHKLRDVKYSKSLKDASDAHNFFGVKTVPAKFQNEPDHQYDVVEYFLKHTRFLPRDIIMGGNFLFQARYIEKSSSDDLYILRQAVRAMCASIFREQITLATALLNGGNLDSQLLSSAESILLDHQILQDSNNSFLALIKFVNTTTFTRAKITRARKKLRAFGFKETDQPFRALYASGLLGYKSDTPDGSLSYVFFSEGHNSTYSLPHSESYAFHPCISKASTITLVKNKLFYAQY